MEEEAGDGLAHVASVEKVWVNGWVKKIIGKKNNPRNLLNNCFETKNGLFW